MFRRIASFHLRNLRLRKVAYLRGRLEFFITPSIPLILRGKLNEGVTEGETTIGLVGVFIFLPVVFLMGQKIRGGAHTS